jgi:predicted ester cyclase
MTATTETNKALLAQLFEAINRADFAPLEPHPGFHETRQYVPPMHQLFADWQTTHTQQVAEGDLVFSYGAVEMTHYGPFAGVAPTGKRIALELWSLDEVREGLVVQHNSASSWADVLRQLGVPAFQAWPARVPGAIPRSDNLPVAQRQANKATVCALLDALSRGAFGATVATAGPNDLSDRFVELRRAFPDLSLTPLAQIAEGDLVATRAELRGTHLGALYGFPATGRALRWEFFCLAQVVDGVVVAQQSSADWNDALAQLGLLGQ